jgi:hypothetical protein
MSFCFSEDISSKVESLKVRLVSDDFLAIFNLLNARSAEALETGKQHYGLIYDMQIWII